MSAETEDQHRRPPLFLVSFRQRDELALLVERAGWAAVSARRIEKLEHRFLLSEARIALVDARGAFDEGIEALRILSQPAEANLAALLVLVSRTDADRIGECMSVGATHFLASPFGDAELVQALRFADRYVTRLSGHGRERIGSHRPKQLGWTLGPDDRVTLSADLAEMLQPSGDTLSLREFLELIGDEDDAGQAAVAKMRRGAELAVFAHALPENKGERLIHTLTADGDDIVARIERPDRPFVARDRVRRDGLTGLADSHGALDWLGSEAAGENSAALIVMAIERFELINKGFGERAGDTVLRTIARRIERFVGETGRRNRLIARIAGAEFAIGLASSSKLDEAAAVARELVGVLEKPIIVDEQTIRVRVRAGVSRADAAIGNAAAILRRAHTALAEAREAENGAIYVMDDDAVDRASDSTRLEADLLPAMEGDEIEILFQPQVSVTTGAIIGVEALSRWRHPVFGEMGAMALFAAADRADRVTDLSRHVLAKALEQASKWPEELDGLRIAVNITADDMAQPDFLTAIESLVGKGRITPDRMTLEITEGELIRDLSGAAAELAELRQAGFRIAIDDFGTGYSSLAYLKSLPLDYLKIDSALSRDIMGERRDRIVVRGIIEMALSLGMTVIAEGVESEEQLAALAREGCTIYQGFLCAPPLPSDRLAELIAAQPHRRK